jgi:hypothetical protein
MNVHNLPVLDLRHTLPNLNNLMLTLGSPVTLENIPTGTLAGQTHHSNPTAPVKTGGRIVSQPVSSIRRGYRTTGKGEIVLPMPATATTKDTGTNGVAGEAAEGQKHGSANLNGHENGSGPSAAVDGQSETGRSAAASWTASLLGWSNGGGKGGRGDGAHKAGGPSPAQLGKAPSITRGTPRSDGAAARTDA